MQRLIVTGFGAFGATQDNPSARLAREIDPAAPILRVSYSSFDEFLGSLDPDSFDRLLMLGYSHKARKLTVEHIAHNRCGSTPDVDEATHPGIIEQGAPNTYHSTLWKRSFRLVPSLAWHHSDNAGDYLCNYAFYKACHTFPTKKVGFVHIPSLSVMRIEDQIRAVRALQLRFG